MILPSKLLPPHNTTVWEKTMADVMHGGAILPDQIQLIRGAKLVNPPPSLLPFLIYEYGLGELTPYVPDLYTLIDEGIQWQRLRGTPRALEMGLGWLGYEAILEEAPKSWVSWNTFQLELDRVRDVLADLNRINGIADLSPPKRSKFWRGFHGYDARPLIWGMGSWGGHTWGEYSGVRIRPDGALWSFGRPYEFDTNIDRSDLELIGAWIEPDWTQYGSDLSWDEFEWGATESTWETGTSITHANAMSSALKQRPVWVAFMEQDGTVIGYRRARAHHYVTAALVGDYQVDGLGYVVTSLTQPSLYIEALTGFGEGNGRVAKWVGLVFDATPAAGQPAGLLWAVPGQLQNAQPAVAVKAVDIAMGESIREQVKYLLRLDDVYELPSAMTILGDEPEGFVVDFMDDSYAEKI